MKFLFILVLLSLVVLAKSLETTDVVVVGAGIGGIKATHDLVNAGRNVIALEADPSRYGGRIFTEYIEEFDICIERGASFFHDSNYNPMVELAQQAGIQLSPMNFDITKAWKDNRPLNANQGGRIYGNYLDIWVKSEPCFQLGRSLAEAIRLCGYDFDDRGVETLMEVDEQIYGDNLELIESTLIDEPPGELGTNYIVPGGYKQILDYMLDYPTNIRSKLRFDSVVTKVDITSPNGKVTVTYIQGGVQKQIVANKVIIAVSMGVLQKNLIQFVPPLPADKQRGIDMALFGNVNKGFLFFDSTTAQTLASYPVNIFYKIGLTPDTRYNDQLTYFYNNQYILNKPMVQSYYSGSFSRHLETLSDATKLEMHMTALDFLSTPQIPLAQPQLSIFTEWGKDRAGGVYSTYKVGAVLSDFTQFTEPVNNKLYFVGEYVLIEDETNPGTVKASMGTVYNTYMVAELTVNKILTN